MHLCRKLGAPAIVFRVFRRWNAVKCYRKAVKATSVLFPLLGTINLLFVFQPPNGSASVMAYRVANAVLQSSQVTTI